MGDFKVIETQEQLDAVIEKIRKEEREKIRKEYEGYLSPDDEKEKYSGYLSPDDEKKKYEGFLSPEDTARKDEQLKKYEINSLKTRIAHEMKIPYELSERLAGEDEKAIRKDAESLAKLLGNDAAELPLKSSEGSMETGENAAYKNILNELKGE